MLGEHGRGGLGRVLRAHDLDLGRDVAIKELLSRGAINEVRFMREALITARLEHPGIVPVHEAGRWPDGTPFYAMKLVAGRSLRDLLAVRKTVEQRIALLHHVIAVADAISYAHGRNIIHRDLKPGNVIVGDFGETVVIDWGLAKDLSTGEESTPSTSSSGRSHDDGLTSVGAVLGTPAYMAPEQQRGEPVDQRADVYAIGVMLWELCSLEKLPPGDSERRRHILQTARIDPDLAAILHKALAPDPDHRYDDAGALAADLKAFKAGVRIAARQYSPWAILSRWMRRHRALASITIAAVIVLATFGALYVRNIAAERDRADTSQRIAKTARAAAESSLDELTLKNAQLLLTSDPSASMDVLAPYRGPDLARANQIRAEANGRGVAVVRAAPHTDIVQWAEGLSSGAIVSLGSDGTLVRTSPDGDHVVLARNVARRPWFSYSRSRHLLTYACSPADICIYDVLHDFHIPTAQDLRGVRPRAVDVSSDGTRLAFMSEDAILCVLDITDPAQPRRLLSKPVDKGDDAKFLDNELIAVSTPAGITFVHMNARTVEFGWPGNSFWDANAAEQLFAVATTRGGALAIAGAPLHELTRTQLCHGPVAGLFFLPAGGRRLAYACREGTIGVWDLEQGKVTPRARVEGHVDRLAVSQNGEYIIAGAGAGSVNIFDLRTDILTTYRGHGFRITSIVPPTSEYRFLISADVTGALRTWPMPPRLARLVASSDIPFYTATFDARSTTLVASTHATSLTTYSSPAAASPGVGAVVPHDLYNVFIEPSDDHRWFATYGLHDTVEIWSFATMARTRVFATRQGSISQLGFFGDTDDIVTAGRDGRLLRWSSDRAELIASIDRPIDKFVLLPALRSTLFSDIDGALWQATAGGGLRRLRASGPHINRLLKLRDERTIYIGDASGDVNALDVTSGRQRILLHASAAVNEVSMNHDGSIVAVSTNDGVIHISKQWHDSSQDRNWTSFVIRVRHQAMTPDGVLVVLSTDGMIWFYSAASQRWLSFATGAGDLRRVTLAPNGDAAAALDFEGRALWLDLAATRDLLASQ